MPLYIYYIVFAVILIGGGVGTMMVGFSNKNKEGNPDYDKHTKSIFTNLSLYYLVAISLGILALITYIMKYVL